MSCRRAWTLCFVLSMAGSLHATEFNAKQIDEKLQQGHWNEVAEICYETTLKKPKAGLAKLKGAYALFQKGYPNAALLMLKKLTPEDWKELPQGQDRFAEVVALFQKKIPGNILPGSLNQVSSLEVAPYLRDEVVFSKARQAFELGDLKTAQTALLEISKSSRYYIGAKYLLGAIAVQKLDYNQAAKDFSIVFEPNVFQQSSEFWNDLTTQMTNHWGANLKISFDSDFLTQSQRVGELAIMGLARSSYASHDFEAALGYYTKIGDASESYSRASLEKIWTLLNLNRHDAALEAAQALMVSANSFEAFEARTARAIALTEVGRTEEARREIEAFLKVHNEAKKSLLAYRKGTSVSSLPAFLQADLKDDLQLQTLATYSKNLQEELQSLRSENSHMYPAFTRLATRLEPLLSQAQAFSSKLTSDHVNTRLKNLEQLYIQSKLVLAETYLEDREHLRQKFAGLANASEETQKAHDRELLATLAEAVKAVDEVLHRADLKNPSLEFRQSELLWELGVARDVVGLDANEKRTAKASRENKVRSLKLAKDVLRKYPTFAKRAQVMFFAGFAEIELNQTADGLHDLNLYVQASPQDEHAPDAYRLLGDHEFDLNHFAEAEAYYKKILPFQSSPIIGYALYKIAWCGYNQRDYAKAFLGLEKAITQIPPEDLSEQAISLKSEARRDLISIYAEVGDYHKAPEYFREFLGEKSGEWLKDFAAQLDKTGQFEKSREIYHVLINMDPNSQEAITYRAAIIDGAYQMHDWKMVIEESQGMQAEYGGKLKTSPDMAKFVEAVLRKVVLFQLFEFERTQTDEVAERTLKLDAIYLAMFRDWPEAQDPLYRHAHFLIRHGDKVAAVAAYDEHWNSYQTQLKEPLREEALRNLIHALKEEEDTRKDGAKEESESAKQILKYSLEYDNTYSKTPYARKIAFIRAAILFKYQQWDQAMLESQKLFEANTEDDVGKRCFQNLRYAYYQKKDWTATSTWATQMLKRQDTKAYAADLKTIWEESMFLRADKTEDDLQAAQLYLQIAKDPDFLRLQQKSLYNAFLRYQKIDHKLDALNVAQDLEKINPHSEDLKQMLGARSALYQEAGDYQRSWPLLKRFIQGPPPGTSAEVLRQATLNAALIAEAIGERDEALALSHQVVNRTPASGAPVANEAARIVKRLEAKTSESPKAWPLLMKEKADYETAAFPRKGDLATRIKKGASWLEDLSKKFLRLAKNQNLSPYYAIESYCVIPHLYQSFGKQVAALGEANPEAKEELAKVTTPLYAKATELADQCITKSIENGHNGDWYRLAVEKWGWAKDPELRAKVTSVMARLEARKSGLDADPLSAKSEEQILETHLQNQESEETWYSLAMKRMHSGKVAMTRLTLEVAMTKWPISGRTRYALAHLEEQAQQADQTHVVNLYLEGAKKGAPQAWVDLAQYHLKRMQWNDARSALAEARQAQLFIDDNDLNILVGELTR